MPRSAAVTLTIKESNVVKVVPSLQRCSKRDCTESGANTGDLTVRWNTTRVKLFLILNTAFSGHGKLSLQRWLETFFCECDLQTFYMSHYIITEIILVMIPETAPHCKSTCSSTTGCFRRRYIYNPGRFRQYFTSRSFTNYHP